MTGFWQSLLGTSLTPEQRREQEGEQERKRLREQLLLQWRTAFPHRKQLYFDLSALYVADAQKTNRRLPTDYLANVLNIICDIYEADFPAELPDIDQYRHLQKLIDPQQTYTLFLSTFLDALISFSNNFPSEAHLPVDYKPTAFTRLLPVFTKDKQNFLPDLQNAFYALRQPIVSNRQQFQERGVFDWNDMLPFAWLGFDEPKPRFREDDYYESEPIYGEPEERRRWRRDKRDFDLQQRREKQSFEEIEVHLWETRKKLHEEAHKRSVHAPSRGRRLFIKLRYAPISTDLFPTYTCHLAFRFRSVLAAITSLPRPIWARQRFLPPWCWRTCSGSSLTKCPLL